jgi:hypothetical protein
LDHPSIAATIGTRIITRQQPTKLHKSRTDREAFKNKTEKKNQLNIPLKTAENLGRSYYRIR